MVVAALLLAGCAERSSGPNGAEEAEEDRSSDPGSGGGRGTNLTLNGTHSSVVTELKLPGFVFGIEGDNCIVYRDNIEVIHEGYVEVDWDDSNPAYAQMQLDVRSDPYKSVTGAPPLRVDLAGIKDNGPGIWMALQPLAGSGVMAQVDMTMTWQFASYDGSRNAEPLSSTCGIG